MHTHSLGASTAMSCFIKKNFFLNLFLEKGEGKEKEGEKHQCVVASCVPSTGDLACNPGMCWESKLRDFGSQASAQSHF